MSENQIFKIAVLVSGRGSNLQALIDAQAHGTMAAQITLVISNNPQAKALERAQKAGISTYVVASIKGETKEDYFCKVLDILNHHKIDLIILAGFMKILPPFFIEAYDNRIINIHPSLLPAFPGLEAQKQALEYGVKVSGCTVHFVDQGCDTGPIILQSVVEVLPDDSLETLSERILVQEHQLLPKAVDLLAKNKVQITNRIVLIKGEKS